MPRGANGGEPIRADWFSDQQIRRFWSHVQKSEKCWLWTASTNLDGYGITGAKTSADDRVRLRSAHRVSYALAFGEAPAGLVIRHNCDRPPCVRPEHLTRGTQLENMRDFQRRGRSSTGLCWEDVVSIRASDRPHTELAAQHGINSKHLRDILANRVWRDPTYVPPVTDFRRQGEKHHSARLTEADVAAARQAWASGATITELVARFGVAPSTMSNLLIGLTWSHVPGAQPRRRRRWAA